MKGADPMTIDHPDLIALRAAVLAAPADDVPRLAYADRLEELGEPERAEFIRLQCELARETRKTYRPKLERGIKKLLRGCVTLRTCPWVNEWLDGYKFGFSADGWGYAVVPMSPSVRFRRGFVAHVTCPLAAWLGERCGRCRGDGRVGWRVGRGGLNTGPLIARRPAGNACSDCRGTGYVGGVAAAVCGSQPVETVTLSDREPWVQSVHPRLTGWWEDSPQHRHSDAGDVLPTVMMEAMADDPRRKDHGSGVRFGGRPAHTPGGVILFESRAVALDALSAAALSVGRGWAGLGQSRIDTGGVGA